MSSMEVDVNDAVAQAASAVTEVNDDLLARVLDGKKIDELLRLFGAALVGKVSGLPSAPVFRSADDAKDRITATSDGDGNRTAVTLDGTP